MTDNNKKSLDTILSAASTLVSYLEYHNKNLTKTQYFMFEDLKGALKSHDFNEPSVSDDRPRIIVEVEGGMVQRVLSDRKVDVDVLDMDNYNNSEDEEEISAYEDMICEASLLQKVW